MSAHYPRFRRHITFDGETALWSRESVRISFYLRRNHPEIEQAVMKALASYLRVVGDAALACHVDYEGDWQPLDEKGWAFVRAEMESSRGANVELAQDPANTTGYEFAYRGRLVGLSPPAGNPEQVCSVTFWLPTEYLEEHGPQRARELAIELGSSLPFDSGHAGLCYLFPEGLLGITQPIREVCFRYPGIDISDSSVSEELGSRLQGAHWLTFLGPPVLGELGGVEGLRSRLRSPATTVQSLDAERAVVTLGPWPEAGDLEAGCTLPEYRELAHVLEPWLHEIHSCWHSFSPEDMHRWHRRFLD
ncbi:DUF3396 domain-containing protein [Myxococcaceae bacterium GXIMD 01537]